MGHSASPGEGDRAVRSRPDASARILPFPGPRPAGPGGDHLTGVGLATRRRHPVRRVAVRGAVCLAAAVVLLACGFELNRILFAPVGSVRTAPSASSAPGATLVPSSSLSGPPSSAAQASPSPARPRTPARHRPAGTPAIPAVPPVVPSAAPSVVAPPQPGAARAHGTSVPTRKATPKTTVPPAPVPHPTPLARAPASVLISAADGSALLGRDVVASGTVGRARYSCFAVGWYVVTARGWTGYFIKTTLRVTPEGAFRTGVLQMGSADETTSSWYPLLLGGTGAGCAWLNQLWAQVPTGEYHGAWPPPGITVLYRAAVAIHRVS